MLERAQAIKEPYLNSDRLSRATSGLSLTQIRRRGKYIPNYFCDFGGDREKRSVRTGAQTAGAYDAHASFTVLLSASDVFLSGMTHINNCYHSSAFHTTCLRSSLVRFGEYCSSLRGLLGGLVGGRPLSVSRAYCRCRHRNEEPRCYVDWTVGMGV